MPFAKGKKKRDLPLVKRRETKEEGLTSGKKKGNNTLTLTLTGTKFR
jgi:hypothetical protein